MSRPAIDYQKSEEKAHTHTHDESRISGATLQWRPAGRHWPGNSRPNTGQRHGQGATHHHAKTVRFHGEKAPRASDLNGRAWCLVNKRLRPSSSAKEPEFSMRSACVRVVGKLTVTLTYALAGWSASTLNVTMFA